MEVKVYPGKVQLTTFKDRADTMFTLLMEYLENHNISVDPLDIDIEVSPVSRYSYLNAVQVEALVDLPDGRTMILKSFIKPNRKTVPIHDRCNPAEFTALGLMHVHTGYVFEHPEINSDVDSPSGVGGELVVLPITGLQMFGPFYVRQFRPSTAASGK